MNTLKTALTLLWLAFPAGPLSAGDKTVEPIRPPALVKTTDPASSLKLPVNPGSKTSAQAAVTVAPTPSDTPPSTLPASAITAQQPGAAPASAEESSAAAGPAHPLIQRVREEADKLGITLIGRDIDAGLAGLRGLRGEGFGFAPPGSLVTAQDMRQANAEIDHYRALPHPGVSVWELYDKPRGWRSDLRWQPKDGGTSREIISRVTTLLRAAMPAERLELRDAQMRLGFDGSDNIHVDGGGYVTVTITLRGPGTLVYRYASDGRVEEIQAPLGAAAVITNYERQLATGILGTVHSAPTAGRYRPGEERRLLILRYSREGQAQATREQFSALEARNAKRVASANAYRASREGRSSRPPPKRSFWGSLRDLIE